MTTQKKTDANLKDNAPEGIALTPGEQAEARKEGAKQDVKDAAADTHRYLTDGNLPGDPPANQYIGHDDIMQWAFILDLGVEEFEKRVKSKGDDAIPEEKAYGLLALERNGQNRTPYVKALMARLGLKADELPGGGPGYTNDVTPTTKL
jgi:hypothetical protein